MIKGIPRIHGDQFCETTIIATNYPSYRTSTHNLGFIEEIIFCHHSPPPLRIILLLANIPQ